ncbi:4-carboxymuconolactone decarboxylase [Citrifermentans bremense]|uniref:4-carboxymuconolactone decarboxylase n=2 Tax=Citrifermentans bremense TaxID=60035 RepID=A0A6S6M0Z5_9BACT|nr:4-carboxymuconolactone decarboxylase [Citrifermentans bremense]
MQNHLNVKQRAIIPIAAFTANGDLDKLRVALCDGLDAGLTVSEIKEILVQLYAYAGFPRSLNGIGTFMTLISEREKEGIRDEKGRGASPLPTSRTSLEFGAENQTRLVGQPVTGPIFDFAPAIDHFLKAHLFGDIFQRDVLNWQDRELATVAALANIEGVNPQLQGHLSIALHNGLSPEQLRDLIGVLSTKCGPKVAENAGVVLDQVLASSKQVPVGDRPAMDNVEATANLQKEKNMSQQHSDLRNGGIFPVGEKNEKYAKYFTGTSYLKMLSTERVFIGNVTFEPGCRNFWHIHHKGGQILLVTGGRGWYQEWGKAARDLRAGDVVNIAPETKHWHGAAKDSWFSHVAVEVPAEGGSTEWLEPVPDEAYNRLPR